jgi:tRNA uridine 5-carboxymethylaminomethyl modification enzyme
MFTSRAEYRLTLREDNADERLTPVGRELGLVDDVRWAWFERKQALVASESTRLGAIVVHPARLTDGDWQILGDGYARESNALELLRRPELGYADVTALSAVGLPLAGTEPGELHEQVATRLEVCARYAGYIERQQREIAKLAKQESLALPDDLDYGRMHGLSNEARQRLTAARPATLGQASRLEGMTPSAVSLILIHLKKRHLKKTA